MAENKVLFLCTGNYYRSRFAEELFNHLAKNKNLNWSACSRGLTQDFWMLGNSGHIANVALHELEKRAVNLSPRRSPIKLRPGEAQEYQLVVALDKAEHQLYIERYYPEIIEVIYWDIKDLGDEPAESALGRLDMKINALISELSANKIGIPASDTGD